MSSEVVVVTGATSGIGRAIVRRFAKDGARIGLIARNREALDDAKREVEQAGGKALVLPADLADWDAVRSAAVAVEEAFGPIDIWVNNAMTTVFAPFKDVEPEEFERATRVTYLGTVWGTKAALDHMLPRARAAHDRGAGGGTKPPPDPLPPASPGPVGARGPRPRPRGFPPRSAL